MMITTDCDMVINICNPFCKYLLDEPVKYFSNMLRTLPQNMLKEEHVNLLNLRSAVTVSRHLEQLHRLSHASIRDDHLWIA